MEYIKATEKDLDQIVMLVQETIKTIYPKYYPKEVVDFFCELHCIEKLSAVLKNITNHSDVVGLTIAEYLPFDEHKLHNMFSEMEKILVKLRYGHLILKMVEYVFRKSQY